MTLLPAVPSSMLEAVFTSRSFFGHFNRLLPAVVDRILLAVKLTTCPLDPCPSWLIKSCCEEVGGPLIEIILSFSHSCFPRSLKEAIVKTPSQETIYGS